ncbi:MAG: CDF family Co(II)/Ni(II) efflux transporter DmeF [Proteobacteria bacterium]|nr:CDF family Co(II)/Ni(II) efflux transporter DmeF [Pseudomonadota bacterium]MBU1545598.1 CDF family Co(II)/Ni(II) efflux transporter DmeF [Pseudomonadota bacterium]MBU2619516.1 CDF family Co(II)/Ni(II) efflux transporter DmeF [Pseudomonadota bacterium]
MHTHSLDTWQHPHDFTVIQEHGEKRTLQVLAITAVTMLFEIAAGMAYGSMALLADGWHMGTHVAAFMITIFAYRFAQKHANNKAFAFGTGKVSVLGGFASAIALIVVALVMLVESGQRIFSPQPIHFNEAIGVAALGLLVNIACAFLLQDHHDHDHGHDKEDHHHHHDHNLKAAYLHVMADALTSVLAIGALISGKYFGWHWLDPLMGIVGALVISRWAYSLVRETGGILLDGSINAATLGAIKEKIEGALDNRIADMHVWKVGPAHYAAILSIVTHYPQKIGYYKELLRDFPNLAHLTVEIHTCEGETCVPR